MKQKILCLLIISSLLIGQLLLSPLCLEREERLIEIDREKYMQRIDDLLTNWLGYGRGETGLFYIWMNASTNKPKPGFCQVSGEYIPYEADTEEFKLPLALWYTWLLTGNETCKEGCERAVDAWWGYAIDSKTDLAAAGFRWGYGGGVDARTGEWNEPEIVHWYAIPQAALFGHWREYMFSCKSAYDRLIIETKGWLYPSVRGIWAKNGNIALPKAKEDVDGCYYGDFVVTFVLPLWAETHDARYIDATDEILGQFMELENRKTGLYPTSLRESKKTTVEKGMSGWYDTAFVESTVSNMILYEVSNHESLHEKVCKDIDTVIEKCWNEEEQRPYRVVNTETGEGKGLLNWWTEYCFVYAFLQRYHETDDEKYLMYAELLGQNYLDAKERIARGEGFRPNELANAGMALLNLYQWTGKEEYLEGAIWLGDYIVENGFYDNGWLKFWTANWEDEKDVDEWTTADCHMTAWTVQFLLSLAYETFMPDWMMWEHLVGINSPYTLTNGRLELRDYNLNYERKDIVFNLTATAPNSAEVYINIPYSWNDGKVLLDGKEIPFEERILSARKYIVIRTNFKTDSNTIRVDFRPFGGG